MRARGVTLAELVLAAGLFSLLMAVAMVLTHRGVTLYRTASGRGDAGLRLKEAARRLERDLIQSRYVETQVARVPPSLPSGGEDGSAVWMLSPADPATGAVVTRPDGAPFWQRNILYYLVVPAGDPCPGGAGANGLDDRCPHKVLVRKEIDSPPVTTPTGSAEEEEEVLLPNVIPYLTRPKGLSVAAMRTSEASVSRAEVVATDLLSMEVQREPDPRVKGEIQISLVAVNLESAGRQARVGTQSLAQSRFAVHHLLSVFPRN
ncbi:MAG: hypothetical protein AB1758_31350 [Candidatus Eremiobacterota bacterium]